MFGVSFYAFYPILGKKFGKLSFVVELRKGLCYTLSSLIKLELAQWAFM